MAFQPAQGIRHGLTADCPAAWAPRTVSSGSGLFSPFLTGAERALTAAAGRCRAGFGSRKALKTKVPPMAAAERRASH
jgi:hypothetical protein